MRLKLLDFHEKLYCLKQAAIDMLRVRNRYGVRVYTLFVSVEPVSF